jgi:hypothetical protein
MSQIIRAYRTASELPFPRWIKGRFGKFLMGILPAQAARIKAAPYSQPLNGVGKLIRNGLFFKAIEDRDHSLITRFLGDYWSSPVSDEFYTGFSHRYETLFLAYHAGIVAETRKAMEKSGQDYRQLIELGSGDGKILEHFSKELQSIPAFHGIDMNLPQTENNRQLYGHLPALSFHHGDAGKWLRNHATRGTVVIANGGVLEYFTRTELLELLKFLAVECSPCVVALTESLAADHDLVNEPATYPYGYELSLSHNYPALLKEAGFAICHTHDRLTTPAESDDVGRWYQVVATA